MNMGVLPVEMLSALPEKKGENHLDPPILYFF